MESSCAWYLKTLEYDGTVWSGMEEYKSHKVFKLMIDNKSSYYWRQRVIQYLNYIKRKQSPGTGAVQSEPKLCPQNQNEK